MGMAKTGKRVDLDGLKLYRIEGNKVVEAWGSWDSLGMMQQLGVTTLPAQAQGQASG